MKEKTIHRIHKVILIAELLTWLALTIVACIYAEVARQFLQSYFW